MRISNFKLERLYAEIMIIVRLFGPLDYTLMAYTTDALLAYELGESKLRVYCEFRISCPVTRCVYKDFNYKGF